MRLVERIVALHRHLERSGIPHAFGGALALAWCTERARGTIDIDVNLFVPTAEVERVLAALPQGIEATDADRRNISTDGQTRLWWDATPVDVFFSTTEFHEDAAGRSRVEAFGGADVPFLSCRDLAVFKAFFDRSQDWVDLEQMRDAGSLDAEAVLGVLVHYLGTEDHRVEHFHQLAWESSRGTR